MRAHRGIWKELQSIDDDYAELRIQRDFCARQFNSEILGGLVTAKLHIVRNLLETLLPEH